MPKPALGRTIHVFADPDKNNGADIAPAVITRVWNDEMVNVRVLLDSAEAPTWMTSVHLYDDRESAEQTPNGYVGANDKRIPAAAFWPPIV